MYLSSTLLSNKHGFTKYSEALGGRLDVLILHKSPQIRLVQFKTPFSYPRNLSENEINDK